MQDLFHEMVTLDFMRSYSKRVNYYRVNEGTVNYETGVSTSTISEYKLKVIPLDKKVHRDYFKKVITDDYSRVFLFTSRTFEPKPKDYLYFDNTRYNVGHVTELSSYTYIISTMAVKSEEGEVKQITVAQNIGLSDSFGLG